MLGIAGDGTGYSRNEYLLMALAGFGHFTTHLLELMFPTAAIAIAADSGMPLAGVMTLSFPAYLLFGLGALPAGILTDTVGCRRTLFGSLALAAICAMATGLAHPSWSLALTLGIMGLALSAYHPAAMSLLSRGVRARGKALGISGMCGNLGVTTAPIVTAVLQSTRLGWRGAYVVVGATALGVVLLFCLLEMDEPALESAAPPGNRDGRDGGAPWHPLVLLCLTATLAGIIYRSNTVVLPAYFAERVTILSYGVATSLAYAVGVPGQYVGGALADRYDLRWLYLLAHLFTLPLLLSMPFLLEGGLVGAGAAVVFFSLGMQPIENSLFAKLTPPQWRATGYGTKFVLTFGLGSLGVGIVEQAERRGDLALTFVWLAAVAVVMVFAASGLLLFGNKPLRNEAGRPPDDSALYRVS